MWNKKKKKITSKVVFDEERRISKEEYEKIPDEELKEKPEKIKSSGVIVKRTKMAPKLTCKKPASRNKDAFDDRYYSDPILSRRAINFWKTGIVMCALFFLAVSDLEFLGLQSGFWWWIFFGYIGYKVLVGDILDF